MGIEEGRVYPKCSECIQTKQV